MYGYARSTDANSNGSLSAADAKVMGGAYKLTELTRKGKTFTASDMRNLAVAKLASVAASRGERSRGLEDASLLASLDGQMPPEPFVPYAERMKREGQLMSNGMVLEAGSLGSLPSLGLGLPERSTATSGPKSPQTSPPDSPGSTARSERTEATASTAST